MFLAFIILVVLGIVCFNADSILVKLIGIVLLVAAFNPLSISLTGKTIPANVKTVFAFGEKVYTGTNDTLKGLRSSFN